MVEGRFDFEYLDETYSVHYTYDSGYQGRLSGNPEHRYPAEGPEAHITELYNSKGVPVDATGHLKHEIIKAICEHAEQKIREAREDMEIARWEMNNRY